MSILDAYKQVRDQDKSLESLAALPQTLIMSMVQRKEIPETDLAMIMAKKAEMAQTSANMKAAQSQQQGQAGTIMEQLMAKNAAEEAARAQPAIQEQTDVGIASNPIPEMRMAGGGIVAFAKGDLVDGKAWEDMTEEERAAAIEDNPALARSRNVVQGVKNFFAPLGEGKNWDPVRKTHEIVNNAIMKPWNRFITEPANIQADKFRGDKPYSYEATPEDKAKAREAAVLKETKSRGLQTADSPLDYDMYDPKKIQKPPIEKNQPPKPPAAAVAAANPPKPSIQDEQRGILDEYKKLYAEDKEASKAARDEAKWMRVMEAGLNIMGGESPYAFANIGKGAAAASKGYAEDVRGLRAEDRERNKQLAALGIKEKEMGLEGRKLDITEQRFKEMSDLERQKINVLKQNNIDDKMATQVERNFATLMSEYRNSLDKGDMTVSDLYRMAQENVASTRGLKTGAPAPTNTGISYNSFMGKK